MADPATSILEGLQGANDAAFPLIWPAQAFIIGFLIFISIMAYRRWHYNNGLTPKRHGDYLWTMPHISVKGKATLFEIEQRTDPDFVEDIRRIMLNRVREDSEGEYDGVAALKPSNISKHLKKDEPPTGQGPGDLVVNAGGASEHQEGGAGVKSQYHTLADLFEKNKHLRFYVGRTLGTEGANVHGYVIFCTPARIDHSDNFMLLREDSNILRGYQTTVREIFTSPEGFIIRNPGYKWKGKTISAFVFFDLQKVADGTSASPQKVETLNVHMSMMTQLEVTVKSWRIAKFNERFARELARANTRLQRFLLIVSRRNSELLMALSTEAYDEKSIRKVQQGLNAFVAAGIMFVSGVVLPEIFRRNIEGPYTDAAYTMLGLSIGFVVVMVAYWWKKSRQT